MISVKVENDSQEATNIIKCQVTARKGATNASPSVVNNDRLLSELSVLRGKYNGAVFDLQKAKTEINSFETEKNYLKDEITKHEGLLLASDTEKKSLMQQLKNSTDELIEIQKKNKTDLASSRREKEKLSAEIKHLKKENNELGARLKQVQSNIYRDKKNENNEYEVEKILDHKEEKSGRIFLVRWQGFGSEDDLWVPEKNLLCPALLKSYLKQKK